MSTEFHAALPKAHGERGRAAMRRLYARIAPAFASQSGEMTALFGELSAGVRKSEKVTLRYPIMPIADGIGSRLIHVDCGQLG